MNRNDFMGIIRDTGRIDRQMIGEVRELLDLFPYFQSAHLLLLKGLNNTGDVKFENQLKQSAIYIADREILYYLLNQKQSSVKNEKEETLIAAPVIADASDSMQVVIESGKNSEEFITVLEKRAAETTPEANTTTSSQVLAGHTILITAESETDESASVVFLLGDESEPVIETVTYTDPSFSYSDGDDLLELDEDEMVDSGQIAEKNIELQSLPDQKESIKQIQADLIEKFIIANPRIEPVREKSGYPVEDISKPFVEEEGGFITETLAKIYITQGYYSRAIDIYEKLSLKYPEKSSYFATQIEKVKALIKY